MNTPTDPPSRSRPRRRLFDGSLRFVAVVAAASAAVLWLRDGGEAVVAAAVAESALLVDLVPRLLAALLLAGLVQVLLPRDKVSHWLGAQSGLRGLLLATLAGTLAPGGPMTSFPLAVALFAAGADVGAVVTFITAWTLLGINRLLVWEIPFMGSDFALLRELASLPLPVIAGLLARSLPWPALLPTQAGEGPAAPSTEDRS